MKNVLLFSLLVFSANDTSAMLVNNGKRVVERSVGSLRALSTRSSGSSLCFRRHADDDAVSALVQDLNAERKELMLKVETEFNLVKSIRSRSTMELAASTVANIAFCCDALTEYAHEFRGAGAALIICGLYDGVRWCLHHKVYKEHENRIDILDYTINQLQSRVQEVEGDQ